MRERKYRYWDSFNKEYIYSEKKLIFKHRKLSAFFMQYEDAELSGNKPILEEYTGLKDKNGREIFEADIIEIHDGNGTRAVIRWQKDTASFACDFFKEDLISGHLFGVEVTEVIGNIHENPELLEVTE